MLSEPINQNNIKTEDNSKSKGSSIKKQKL